jgi:multidrug efflux pump subunit AcrA (membrane-fusion protein)
MADHRNGTAHTHHVPPRFALPATPGPTGLLSRTPRWARRAAVLMVLFVGLLVPVLLYAPWVQTVHGRGRAIAFNPVQRPQPLVSPIEGRVYRWYVREFDRVRAGQMLAELKDNDPQILERLETQKLLVEERLALAESQVAEQRLRLENTKLARPFQLLQADNLIGQAEAQIAAAQSTADAREADEVREQLNYERTNRLNQSKLGDITSKDQVEQAERLRNVAAKQKLAALASVTALGKSRDALRSSKDTLEKTTLATINQEQAQLAGREADLRAVKQQLQQITTQVERQKQQYIYAPADGMVSQILVNADGQLVRAAQPLATLVPDIKETEVLVDPRAGAVGAVAGGVGAKEFPALTADSYPGIVAELFVDGNDLPLVAEGERQTQAGLATADRVLLQFEGWPAVQVAGVPNAAAGLFEGKVYRVDPTADRTGRFRVLVEPLNPGTEPRVMGVAGRQVPVAPWPNQELLRQGVQAQGWVLVREVSVGFELWRLLNGFPPAREIKAKSPGGAIGPVGK